VVSRSDDEGKEGDAGDVAGGLVMEAESGVLVGLLGDDVVLLALDGFPV